MAANLDKRLEALEAGADGPAVIIVPWQAQSVEIRGVVLERSAIETDEQFQQRVRQFASQAVPGKRAAVIFAGRHDERL